MDKEDEKPSEGESSDGASSPDMPSALMTADSLEKLRRSVEEFEKIVRSLKADRHRANFKVIDPEDEQ
ncbi:hypothetical protein [Aureimonas psammosilenae]|uniref:hypothetical protein n=1 Tax=Aureimonas psammosilenae TaxID=2495496 RepID=UPI001260B905|nr:hypothetical protein [Aureimonas psammosilenae]